MIWPSSNPRIVSANARKAGLSLLETMIVMAILALMAGIAAAAFRPNPQDRAEVVRRELARQVQHHRFVAMQGTAPRFVALQDLLVDDAARPVLLCDLDDAALSVTFFVDGTIAATPICVLSGDAARMMRIDWLTARVGLE